MRFYELSLIKHRFIVTSNEIRQLLDGYHHFPEKICGLGLYYPAKVLYDASVGKYCEGTVCCEEFADFHTYEKLLSDIKVITKPLKLEFNGKVYRTKVRISCDAKKISRISILWYPMILKLCNQH